MNKLDSCILTDSTHQCHKDLIYIINFSLSSWSLVNARYKSTVLYARLFYKL